MNPNFDHLEEGLNTVHVELGRVRNIPGLNVNQQFNDMRRAMDEGFRRLGQAILTADNNMFARLQNSQVVHDNADLWPMHGSDGQPVPNFPSNLNQLRGLDEIQLAGILAAFRLNQDGNVELKRKMFAKYIGVVVTI